MNGVTTQDAKTALDLIEQQKGRAASVARMPLWLNIVFSALVTCLAYFELINRKLMLSDMLVIFIVIGIFVLLAVWAQYLNKKGLKVKWLPNKPITYFSFVAGYLFAFFSEDIADFAYESLAPWGVYVFPLVTLTLFVYLGHRFPLSQGVRKEAMDE